jgi:hypothetical protein
MAKHILPVLGLLLVVLLSSYPAMAAQEDEYGLLHTFPYSPGIQLIFTAYGTCCWV